MTLFIRDLTTSNDFMLQLPQDVFEPKEGHEYILVDHDGILPVNDYVNIRELVRFVKKWEEMDTREFHVICKVCDNLEHIDQVLSDGNYVIIDFDDITRQWASADIHSHSDRGRVLHECGYANLPFPYKDEYESYINWETVWNDAETGGGWTVVRTDQHDYLVNTGEYA